MTQCTAVSSQALAVLLWSVAAAAAAYALLPKGWSRSKEVACFSPGCWWLSGRAASLQLRLICCPHVNLLSLVSNNSSMVGCEAKGLEASLLATKRAVNSQATVMQAYRHLWLALSLQVPELQAAHVGTSGRPGQRSGSLRHSSGSSSQLLGQSTGGRDSSALCTLQCAGTDPHAQAWTCCASHRFSSPHWPQSEGKHTVDSWQWCVGRQGQAAGGHGLSLPGGSLQALLGLLARCCTPAAVLGGTQLTLEKLEAGRSCLAAACTTGCPVGFPVGLHDRVKCRARPRAVYMARQCSAGPTDSSGWQWLSSSRRGYSEYQVHGLHPCHMSGQPAAVLGSNQLISDLQMDCLVWPGCHFGVSVWAFSRMESLT